MKSKKVERPVKLDDLDTPEGARSTIGQFVYKARSFGPKGYQTGQQYALTIDKLEVGKPVRIMKPFQASYKDIKSFSNCWRAVC